MYPRGLMFCFPYFGPEILFSANLSSIQYGVGCFCCSLLLCEAEEVVSLKYATLLCEVVLLCHACCVHARGHFLLCGTPS